MYPYVYATKCICIYVITTYTSIRPKNHANKLPTSLLLLNLRLYCRQYLFPAS